MFHNVPIIVFAVFSVLLVTSSLEINVKPGRPTRPPRPTRPSRPTRSTTQKPTTRPPPDVIQEEGCGGILEGNRGLISYNNEDRHLEPDTVCVWTIRSPGTGNLHVQLDYDNFTQNDQNTYISIWSVGNAAVLQKDYTIFSGDRNTYTIAGQVGYIIYRRSNIVGEDGSGFQLYFRGDSVSVDESVWTGGNKTHVHFHLNEAEGYPVEFSYPENGDLRYKPNEFGSWVINPEATKVRNTLRLYYIDFEDFSCSDFIKIHQVRGDSPVLLDSKCNTNTYFSSSFKYDTVREPFIITLSTDYRNERTGFILYYENDRYRSVDI